MNEILRKSWTFALRAEGLSPGTIANYDREVRKFCAFRDEPLVTATVHHCREFLAQRQETSPFAANMGWRALRSLYRWLAVEGECGDITVNIRQPKMPLRPTKIVTEDEYRKLINWCVGEGWVGTRDAAIFAVLWATGLRRSELARLTVGDINISEQRLIVRSSKNGEWRSCPLTVEATRHLLAWLRTRRAPDGCQSLWMGTKGPLSSDGVRQAIERRTKAAGVDVSAHQFRRAIAARWIGNGGSETSLMRVAGWKQSTMVARYTRSVSHDLAEVEYRRVIGA